MIEAGLCLFKLPCALKKEIEDIFVDEDEDDGVSDGIGVENDVETTTEDIEVEVDSSNVEGQGSGVGEEKQEVRIPSSPAQKVIFFIFLCFFTGHNRSEWIFSVFFLFRHKNAFVLYIHAALDLALNSAFF